MAELCEHLEGLTATDFPAPRTPGVWDRKEDAARFAISQNELRPLSGPRCL
jgi:hypothetical protein